MDNKKTNIVCLHFEEQESVYSIILIIYNVCYASLITDVCYLAYMKTKCHCNIVMLFPFVNLTSTLPNNTAERIRANIRPLSIFFKF